MFTRDWLGERGKGRGKDKDRRMVKREGLREGFGDKKWRLVGEKGSERRRKRVEKVRGKEDGQGKGEIIC